MSAKERKKFCNEVCNCISREFKIEIQSLNAFDICFGYDTTKSDLLIYHSILIAKSHIYNFKVGGEIPPLSSYKHLLNTVRYTEKPIAFNSNKIYGYIRETFPAMLLGPLPATSHLIKCAMLAQLIRSLTASQKVPSSIPGLAMGLSI